MEFDVPSKQPSVGRKVPTVKRVTLVVEVGGGVAFSMRKWTSDRRRALTVHACIHERMREHTTQILFIFSPFFESRTFK